MAPNFAAPVANPVEAGCGNGNPDIARLQDECERLRRSLAAAEKERDEYRSMLYAHIRSTITLEEKAEAEKWAKDIVENRGLPVSELLDVIKECKTSR